MFDYKFLTLFVILSIINVVFATIKSIITVNGNKWIASILSGGYYAFYNIMMLYTVADFPMWQKCVITFACNLVGVFVVKWGEEKARKDKLWKVEATLKGENIDPTCDDCLLELKANNISYNYIDLEKYLIVNCYCATQTESATVREILNKYDAKYFVSESKSL